MIAFFVSPVALMAAGSVVSAGPSLATVERVAPHAGAAVRVAPIPVEVQAAVAPVEGRAEPAAGSNDRSYFVVKAVGEKTEIRLPR